MNDLDQITGNDIYNDLKKIKWVKEKYPEEKPFNFKDYESEKWYFEYLNSQSFIEADYKEQIIKGCSGKLPFQLQIAPCCKRQYYHT